MPKHIRVIARMDIKGPNLVKGIHLEGLRVLGKPEQFARHYYETGADELIYVDVVASLYNRNSLADIIIRTAKDIFIPLTVGGGIRTLKDIRDVLRAGADKVALNTAAVKNPDIIKEAAVKFGSSTIVISIEAIKHPDGGYFVYTDNGREYTGKPVMDWAKTVCALGAGEILLVSVDREGTGLGYDIELTRQVSEAVSIPVIACGGAGNPAHVAQVITQGQADAVSLASVLHYDYLKQRPAQDLNPEHFSAEGNIEYLQSGRSNSRIQGAGVGRVKEYLLSRGIACRYYNKPEVVNA